MAIKLKDFLNKTRTVIVTFDGDECKVTYLVNAVTPAYTDSFKETKTLSEVYGKQISDLVVSWEVLDEMGEQIKPTAEFATTLSTDFLRAVLVAIREDLKLPKDQKNF